jgi:oligoribonuclease (3'-5' exoribonuclease)
MTAEHLLRINDNPAERAQDPECQYIQSVMPIEEAAMTGNPSLLQLEVLLKRNPKNKMAFEYMIAYHLLAGNMQEVVNHLPDFQALGYTVLPTHVQEALLFIASQTPNFNEDLIYKSVDRSTYERFLEFRQILLKYQGNKNYAMQDLQKQFGDTYWFYLMYYKPAVRHPEGQHGYTR